MSAYDDDPALGGEADEDEAPRGPFGMTFRIVVAAVIVIVAVLAECIVMVPADQAVVINRLGDPTRVLTRPGLAWKLPAPIETVVPIDLRLHTTSTGLQDVGTRDGLRVLVQTYTAWQVPDDPQHIIKFLRALRNQPDEAARQLRSFVSAAMHITASNFNFADLVNSNQGNVRIDAFEQQLRGQVAPQMLQGYGIEIRQVGVERLTLPAATLAATVSRMSAERETVAAQRTADGLRRAAQIQADADRDARETVATAQQQSAHIQADAEVSAAGVYAKAYRADPGLYTTLRSLDAVGKIVGPNPGSAPHRSCIPRCACSNGSAADRSLPEAG